MSANQTKRKGRDMGELMMPCLFIIISLMALWDTTRMLDPDSYIFPRTVATVMLVLSVVLITRNLLNISNSQQEASKEGASTVRRIGLIAGMIISCVMMPFLGFMISGLTTFIFLMLVSMYDTWSAKTKIIYPLVAVSLVVGFYLLFSKVLLVPLPVGVFFE